MNVVSHGHAIHYLAEGAGEALIMVPGLLMSAARWSDVGYVSRFAREFRVIAVDPLGHGMSDKPHQASEYDWSLCADHIVAVMDHEGVQDAHLWGYSRGAAITNVLATEHPERVRSLILGGAQPGRLPDGVIPIVASNQQSMADALRRNDWDAFWKAQGIDDAATRAILGNHQDGLAIAACLDAATHSLSIEVDLSRLRRPPLVYIGEQEPAFAFFKQAATAHAAEFHSIPGRGHSGAFHDIEAVSPIVRGFLLRDAGEDGR